MRGQSDALRLAARQGRRATVEREVAQTHLFQKRQAALNLWQEVACDVGFALAQHIGLQEAAHPLAHLADRPTRHLGDGHTRAARGRVRPKPHRPGLCVQPRAFARRASLIDQVIDFGFGKALFAAAVFVVAHRIVQDLALLAREARAGAHAVGAPTVFAVVREQARVEFGVAGGAHRTGADGREHF